jgi:hypothetical protein
MNKKLNKTSNSYKEEASKELNDIENKNSMERGSIERQKVKQMVKNYENSID